MVLLAVGTVFSLVLGIPRIPPFIAGAAVAFGLTFTVMGIFSAIHWADRDEERFQLLDKRTGQIHSGFRILSANSKTRLISKLWSMESEIQTLTSDYRLTRLLSEKYGEPAVMEQNGQQYTLDMLQNDAVYRFANRYATRLIFLLEELRRHGIVVDSKLDDLIATVVDADGVDNIADELTLIMNQQSAGAL